MRSGIRNEVVQSAEPASVDDVASALAAHDYLADEGLATAIFLALRAAPAAAARGRGGRRQDRGGQGAGPLDRRRAASGCSATRASTSPRPSTSGTTPASCCTCVRPRRAARTGRRGRAVLRAVPRAAAAAAGASTTTSGAAAGAARSTRSTGPTTSSRRSCSRSSPTTRSPCPSSARSAPTVPPVVVLTSNRTRDVHDALKRRCLYHWVEHPDFEREVAIVRLRAPEVPERARPRRSRPRSRRCAASSSTSRRASPRRSTGPQALAALGRTDARRARGRRHARHGPEVPRGPGAGPRPRRSTSSSQAAVARSA